MTKADELRSWGFTVGARDPRLNRAYAGQFMVVEWHTEDELPTWDGRDGPWCVVGDNLDALIEIAHDCWVDTYGSKQ